jgi:hypothetical protein
MNWIVDQMIIQINDGMALHVACWDIDIFICILAHFLTFCFEEIKCKQYCVIRVMHYI